MNRRSRSWQVAALCALCAALPAIAQEAPEVLLPEGFGDPPPPPPAASPPSGASDGPARPAAAPRPDEALTENLPAGADEAEEAAKDPAVAALEAALAAQRADVPPAGRRSLDAIGFLAQQSGGFSADAFGGRGGVYLLTLLKNVRGPLTSRWGSILARRLLASRTATPANIAGQDWAAERARLLLAMGEANAGRALVQQVDASRYTAPLYAAAMQAYLATGDLAGLCPLVEGGVRASDDRQWKLSQAICAALSGEQGRATSYLNQARRFGWASGIDYFLTEKVVGAGFNGRRSVKIEWEPVDSLDSWRVGTALATGVEVPERLLAGADRTMLAWRSTSPALSASARLRSADIAAEMGVLSGDALVSLYAQAASDGGAPAAIDGRANTLATAYAAREQGARLEAMRSLWADTPDRSYARLLLTSGAAARITPSSAIADADRQMLVAAMLSTGLDRQAARWGSLARTGELDWALLAVGRPGSVRIAAAGVDDFVSNDDSSGQQKAKLFVAALAGLGRIDAAAANDAARTLKIGLGAQSAWSRAIDQAAQRGEEGTVALLAAAGLQGRGWGDIPAYQFFHLVRALATVGLEAEARMIAAEAVTRA